MIFFSVTLEDTETFTNSTKHFLSDIKRQNEYTLKGKQTQEIYDMLLQATIVWNVSEYEIDYNSTNGSSLVVRTKRNLRFSTETPVIQQEKVTENSIETMIHEEEYSIEEHIAHIFHFASVAILGIVSIEVRMEMRLLKIIFLKMEGVECFRMTSLTIAQRLY